MFVTIASFLLLHAIVPAATETVNADNGIYHDTGNGPCTRRVTVGGEADCYYSSANKTFIY